MGEVSVHERLEGLQRDCCEREGEAGISAHVDLWKIPKRLLLELAGGGWGGGYQLMGVCGRFAKGPLRRGGEEVGRW